MERHHRHRPRRLHAEQARRTVRERRLDASFEEPRIDSVENSLEPARRDPRRRPSDEAAAGREALVR
jgi:hypothetical protein